jgi:hypothetical protein
MKAVAAYAHRNLLAQSNRLFERIALNVVDQREVERHCGKIWPSAPGCQTGNGSATGDDRHRESSRAIIRAAWRRRPVGLTSSLRLDRGCRGNAAVDGAIASGPIATLAVDADHVQGELAERPRADTLRQLCCAKIRGVFASLSLRLSPRTTLGVVR